MTRRIFMGTGIGLAAAAVSPGASPEQEAQEAAEAWLALVDAGKYGESWDGAAAIFKQQVKRDQWETMVGGVRGKAGALGSRSLKSAQFTKQLPGAPDGEYVVIQYAASFANKQAAVETITPMKDPDGVWRVSGYFIR
jgi:hypothetical protein